MPGRRLQTTQAAPRAATTGPRAHCRSPRSCRALLAARERPGRDLRHLRGAVRGLVAEQLRAVVRPRHAGVAAGPEENGLHGLGGGGVRQLTLGQRGVPALRQRPEQLRADDKLRAARPPQLQHGAVVAVALVVARGEDAHEAVAVHDLVAAAAHLLLVGPHDGLDVVALAELLRDVRAEVQHQAPVAVAGRAVHAEGPLPRLGHGVGPEDVVDVPLLPDRLRGHRPRHVLQVLQVPLAVAQAAVHHQDLAAHQAAQGQVVEGVLEGLVDLLPAVQGAAGGAEAHGPHVLVLVPELVVATHQEDLVRVGHLEREDQAHGLQLVRAAVHPVAVEDVGRAVLVREAEVLEPEEEVPELAVEVAEDARGHGRTQ
mmetsp:Transcript_9556/g.29584  ORF Transcript_9556/g.29584 Transcript_9556/m.29584 type:complete len:371 (-) Transcript_9556:457-1569(-)